MKSSYALRSICQECNKSHMHNEFVVTSVNIDEDTEIAQKLFDFKLNSVTCPQCKTSYTFETKMVIYSPAKKFAVIVNPGNYFAGVSDDIIVPTHIFPNDFIFREVSFQIEATEKCRIFNDGFNDISIEYIKSKIFTDKDTLPFSEVNMVYTSFDNNFIYFTKYDYNNNILGNYHVCIDEYIHMDNSSDLINRNIWHKINRQTINKYISDKER